MNRIISALLSAAILGGVSVAALAAAEAPELAADAPSRHVVVPGDTLWSIARTFLKDPARWSELWKLNADQLKSPQRLYPGQVIVLDRSANEPRLRLETVVVQPEVREEARGGGIPAIPQRVIEPFLSQPLVAEEDALDASPRIVAFEDGRVLGGAGSTAYATGLKSDQVSWNLYRPGNPLVDPDTQEVLGHEAIFLGTAKLVRKGETATLRIANANQEVGRGDRLVPTPHPDIVNYPLRVPEKPVNARVISVYGDALGGARHSIVALSRGKKDGVDRGHVLALYTPSTAIVETFKGTKNTVLLPEERFGLLYVFRSFDRVSYALVMETIKPISAGDVVHNP